jgi:hypothetical protein
MNLADKRKFSRIKIHNLISCVCLGEEGHPVRQLMGTALDISKGGLLVQAPQKFEPGNILLIAADEKDQITEINAKAVFCREAAPGRFNVGVRFQGTPDQQIQFIRCMIRANFYRRGFAQRG